MDFDISRLRRADYVVATAAIALFVFMFFFKWFGGGVSGDIPPGTDLKQLDVSSSGWQTFTNSRWVWLITILVALGSTVLVAERRRLPGPLQPGALVAGLGASSTALILYRILDHPTFSQSVARLHASFGIRTGIWLGLIAALAITYGGYLQMRADAAPATDVPEPADEAFTGMTLAGAAQTPPPATARPPAPSPAQPPPAPGRAPPAPADRPQPAPASPGDGERPPPTSPGG
jgi:hypothetical protein